MALESNTMSVVMVSSVARRSRYWDLRDGMSLTRVLVGCSSIEARDPPFSAGIAILIPDFRSVHVDSRESSTIPCATQVCILFVYAQIDEVLALPVMFDLPSKCQA